MVAHYTSNKNQFPSYVLQNFHYLFFLIFLTPSHATLAHFFVVLHPHKPYTFYKFTSFHILWHACYNTTACYICCNDGNSDYRWGIMIHLQKTLWPTTRIFSLFWIEPWCHNFLTVMILLLLKYTCIIHLHFSVLTHTFYCTEYLSS